MTDKLDIVGIGNAMVDAIIPSNKDEVEKNNLNRDSMNLIDEELKNSLHNNYSIKEMAGGGSLLRGIDRLVAKETQLPVTIAEDPLISVANGAGKVLQNIDYWRNAAATA